MKRCQVCNDFARYEDSVEKCPLCGATLIQATRRTSNVANSDYSASNSTRPSSRVSTSEPVRPTRNLSQPTPQSRQASSREQASSETTATHDTTHIEANTGAAPRYETPGLFTSEYRGIVLEVNNRVRYNSSMKKWINTIFRGEPYQFGNTTQETTLRIEEIAPGQISGRSRDFIVYGDIEGRVYSGDDVTVRAKRRGDRNIITRMYSNQTQSPIRTSPQVPAWVIWILTLVIGYIFVSLSVNIVDFVRSGALRRLVSNIFSYVVTIAIIVFIIRLIFRRRW